MHKVRWLETFLGQKIEHHKLNLKEIQSLKPEEVVEEKAKEAFAVLGRPVLIEDTSLSCEALGRLPGTYIKFFVEEIGNEGICKLLNAFSDRSAVATVIYGFYDGEQFSSYRADVKGQIAHIPKGEGGHGWDPIFIPEGQTKTYAQMNQTEYEQYSVRNRAVLKLKEAFRSLP
jgi:non-canonical purine NTP pyrophosphatase (RdgB/HAM1 family)